MKRPEQQKNTVYGLVFGIQKAEIQHYCMNQCRKIIMSVIIDNVETGPMFTCREDNCPHEVGRTPPMDTEDGDVLIVRKLKDKQKAPRLPAGA